MKAAKNRQVTRKVILPKFGLGIRVTDTDTELVVSGIQLHGEPACKERPAYEHLADPESRVEDVLNLVDEDRKLPQIERSKAPHFVFANAKTEPDQKKFVENFGPVLASKIERKYSDTGSPTMIAYQNKEALRFEQHLYSLVFELTGLVNDLLPFSRQAFKVIKPEMRVVLTKDPEEYSGYHEIFAYIVRETEKKAKEVDSDLRKTVWKDDFGIDQSKILTPEVDDQLNELRAVVSKINKFVDPFPFENLEELLENPNSWRHYRSWQCTQEELSKASSLDVIDRANGLLCAVFNRFPVLLCYAEGMAQQMPDTDSSGILPALYYMLRLEYLFEREIKHCADSNCGWYFVPSRTNRKYCCDRCSENAKNRRSDRKKAEKRKLKGSLA